MLNPSEFVATLPDGTGKKYILHSFPAIAGREIITQYPTSAMPKIGDYHLNEELMLKLMCYVGVEQENGTVQCLTTRALVDNHVPDFETLMKIEMAMMQKNCSFFQQGKMSNILEMLAEKVQALITKTLMDFSQQSQAND